MGGKEKGLSCSLCSIYWDKGWFLKRKACFLLQRAFQRVGFIVITHEDGWTLFWLLSLFDFKVIHAFLKSSVVGHLGIESRCFVVIHIWKELAFWLQEQIFKKILNPTWLWFESGLITKEPFNNNGLEYLNIPRNCS